MVSKSAYVQVVSQLVQMLLVALSYLSRKFSDKAVDIGLYGWVYQTLVEVRVLRMQLVSTLV